MKFTTSFLLKRGDKKSLTEVEVSDIIDNAVGYTLQATSSSAHRRTSTYLFAAIAASVWILMHQTEFGKTLDNPVIRHFKFWKVKGYLSSTGDKKGAVMIFMDIFVDHRATESTEERVDAFVFWKHLCLVDLKNQVAQNPKNSESNVHD